MVDGGISESELQAAKVSMVWRDSCASTLVSLNECRRKTFFLPWKCEHERHAYEKCQYLAYKARLAPSAE